MLHIRLNLRTRETPPEPGGDLTPDAIRVGSGETVQPPGHHRCPAPGRGVEKVVSKELTAEDVEFEIRGLIARQAVDDQLKLPLDPLVLSEQIHDLPERHAAETGIPSVDVVDQHRQRLELHPEGFEILLHPARRFWSGHPELLGVPSGGSLEGDGVALHGLQSVQDFPAPLEEVVDGLQAVVIGLHGLPVSVDTLLEHLGGRGDVGQDPLRALVDVPVQDLQLPHQIDRMPFGLDERHPGLSGKGLGFQEGGNRVRVPLEDGLLVSGDADKGFEDPGRIGVEIQDLADGASIFVVIPTGLFEAPHQPPGGCAEQCALVLAASLLPALLPNRHRFGDEPVPAFFPETGGADDLFRDVERYRPGQEEGLAFKFELVETGEDVPVNRRIGRAQRTEQSYGDVIEERWHVHRMVPRPYMERGPHFDRQLRGQHDT